MVVACYPEISKEITRTRPLSERYNPTDKKAVQSWLQQYADLFIRMQAQKRDATYSQ